MAQPTQVFATGNPGREYSVIDNSAAPSYPTLNAGTHIGYDTTTPGANSQGLNAFGNGTIPDAVKRSSSFTTAAPVSTTIKYLNPA